MYGLFRSWTNYLNVLQGVHMKWVPKMIRQTHIITAFIQSIDTLKGDKEVTSMSTLFITDKLLGVYIYIKLWRQGNQPLSPISLTDIKESQIWCRVITTQILEILTTIIRWLVHWAFSCSWRMSFLIFVAWGMTPITTTKIIYDVTIYGVAFKIMTPLNLKFIKVTHHIKNLQLG